MAKCVPKTHYFCRPIRLRCLPWRHCALACPWLNARENVCKRDKLFSNSFLWSIIWVSVHESAQKYSWLKDVHSINKLRCICIQLIQTVTLTASSLVTWLFRAIQTDSRLNYQLVCWLTITTNNWNRQHKATKYTTLIIYHTLTYCPLIHIHTQVWLLHST